MIESAEDEIKPKYVYRGHQNIIHELHWSSDDQYLVSCSSDFTAKVWEIPKYSGTSESIDEEKSESKFLVASLIHPSYVYSAKFHPKKFGDCLIIATACFDAKIRIWKVATNGETYLFMDGRKI